MVRGLVINRFAGAGILLQTNGGNIIGATTSAPIRPATSCAARMASAWQIDGHARRITGSAASTPAARNVISGNLQNGVDFRRRGDGQLVASNFIGTNGSGMSAIAEQRSGVVIDSVRQHHRHADAGNVISGNGQNGIAVLGASSRRTRSTRTRSA